MKRAVLLLMMVLTTGACATTPDGPTTRPDCAETGAGHPDNKSPVMCVSVYADPDGFGGLLVHPSVVTVSRRGGVVLQWDTRRGSEPIEIEMKDEKCTEVKTCRGQGTCTIRVKPGLAGGETCAYWVKVTPKNMPTLVLDPIVKIDTD